MRGAGGFNQKKVRGRGQLRMYRLSGDSPASVGQELKRSLAAIRVDAPAYGLRGAGGGGGWRTGNAVNSVGGIRGRISTVVLGYGGGGVMRERWMMATAGGDAVW